MEVNQVYQGDSAELMKKLPDNFIDLTVTQQVASPKSASQTSLNPDIKRNKFEGLQDD